MNSLRIFSLFCFLFGLPYFFPVKVIPSISLMTCTERETKHSPTPESNQQQQQQQPQLRWRKWHQCLRKLRKDHDSQIFGIVPGVYIFVSEAQWDRKSTAVINATGINPWRKHGRWVFMGLFGCGNGAVWIPVVMASGLILGWRFRNLFSSKGYL